MGDLNFQYNKIVSQEKAQKYVIIKYAYPPFPFLVGAAGKSMTLRKPM